MLISVVVTHTVIDLHIRTTLLRGGEGRRARGGKHTNVPGPTISLYVSRKKTLTCCHVLCIYPVIGLVFSSVLVHFSSPTTRAVSELESAVGRLER